MKMDISNELEERDFGQWDRKEVYEHFSNYINPTMQITTKIELGSFVNYVKREGLNFYPAFAFCCLSALTSIPESHYIVINNRLYYSSVLNAGFTILDNEKRITFTDGIPFCPNIHDFNSMYVNHRTQIFTNHKEYSESKDNNKKITVFFTCLPWGSFTSISNPIFNSQDNHIRICWGKYYYENDKLLIDVSFQAHHGLFDGRHPFVFFKELESTVLSFSS